MPEIGRIVAFSLSEYFGVIPGHDAVALSHSFIDIRFPSEESIENAIIIPSRPAAFCACDNFEYIPPKT